MWGNEFIELEILVSILNGVKARKNLVFGQCYAGNILDMEVNNSCVVTANVQGKASYGCLGKFRDEYDEFLLHFLSFIHGQYPDGSKVPSGGNNLKKAHQYTLEHDIFSPCNPKRFNIGDAIEVPQIRMTSQGELSL